jgi:hypothetical protein
LAVYDFGLKGSLSGPVWEIKKPRLWAILDGDGKPYFSMGKCLGLLLQLLSDVDTKGAPAIKHTSKRH